jgi:DNA-binding MarR family transcriptional regulator
MDSWSGRGMRATEQDRGQAASRRAPSLLLISDGGTVPVVLDRAVSALGMTASLAGLDGPVPAYGGGHNVIWTRADDVPSEALLDALEGALTDGGCGLIFDLGRPALDPVWTRFGDQDGVILLSDPDPNEVHACLSAMLGRQTMALHDEVATRHQQELNRLQEEVGRIARTLAKMSEPEARLLIRSPDASREPPNPFIEGQLRETRHGFASGMPLQPLGEVASQISPPISGREVRRLIRLRRHRDEFFEPELFADPAWDMLLDLYAARLEHNRVSVSSLCIAAAVPATTALRWIKALTTSGVFERRADPHDGRRIFVALSDSAAAAMHAYFGSIVDDSVVI